MKNILIYNLYIFKYLSKIKIKYIIIYILFLNLFLININFEKERKNEKYINLQFVYF